MTGPGCNPLWHAVRQTVTLTSEVIVNAMPCHFQIRARMAVWPAVILALQLPVGAMAFNSYTPYVHGDITTAAAKAVGWKRAYWIDNLCGWVRQVDWDEAYRVNTGCGKIIGTSAYVAAHHFDRPPSTSIASAFLNGQKSLYLNYVFAQAQGTNRRNRNLYLGALLHGLEDVFSHSNYVDLNCADKATVRSALINSINGPPYAAPPVSFKLTTYCADADHDPLCAHCDGGVNHPYNHDDYCKDKSLKNAESQAYWLNNTPCGYSSSGNSKFWLAYDCAVDAVKTILKKFPPEN